MSYSAIPTRTQTTSSMYADVNQLQENIDAILDGTKQHDYLEQQYDVYRQAIINGDMRIAQRGTSFAAIANGTYCLDRFVYGVSGTMVHTISQSTNVPASTNFKYSMKIDCTTADASIAAGDFCYIAQKIEGYNFVPYVGKTATIGFWVSSPKTGVHCISFLNSTNDRSYVGEYTVSAANTFEYKTITLDFDYTGGTWDYTNGIGLYVIFALAIGSTYQTTADTWQTGSYLATADQVNVCDDAANDFYITGISMNIGSAALPFPFRDYGYELSLCQRYYEKITFGSGTSNPIEGFLTSAYATANDYASWFFGMTNKRTSGYTAGYTNGTEYNVQDIVIDNSSLNQIIIYIRATGSDTMYTYLREITADAEL